jgi:hypothetical protein
MPIRRDPTPEMLAAEPFGVEERHLCFVLSFSLPLLFLFCYPSIDAMICCGGAGGVRGGATDTSGESDVGVV